mmetsp:Transcript_6544/g.16937  ORF Transcript_6544/g.16937 Transcript_6544/m.16937 type:complete len:156 (+) Transcript_6544:74-541(+)|eukprot:CAMPEP_0115840764 /NCGR_PEP_ID=MMETSP0287-20121206/6939_1 /TAXON_ID=412157 /ORGANISM="Chrysochromulina rotalis, Strain UIO044" /LENGTH=155 /DNA_ID=CAMNT_0003294385 /DNA_START=62 /DNA_END=529 /DNA_ORIENTATION=+
MFRTGAKLLLASAVVVLAADQFECMTGNTGDKACFGNFKGEVPEGHDPFKADQTCRDWCTMEECKTLDGNLTQECGLCGVAAKCNPSAADYFTYKDKTEGNSVTCLETACVNECEGITGNPHFECGGCSGEAFKCKPGADHFDDWFERHGQKKEL